MPTVILLILTMILAAARPAQPSDMPKLTLVPTDFTVLNAVYYDEAGQVKLRNSHSFLMLRVLSDRRLVFPEVEWSQGKVRLTTAVTDGDESLLLANGGGYVSEYFGKEIQYQIRLAVAAPTKPYQRIDRIAGTIAVGIADEQLRRVEFAKIADAVAAPIVVDGQPAVELTLARTSVGFSLAGTRPAFASFASIRFTTAEGVEYHCGKTGTGHGPQNGLVHYYQGKVPDSATVQLFFYQNIRQFEVPFEIKDLRLTSDTVSAAEKPRRVLKSIEVDAADLAPGNGKAGK